MASSALIYITLTALVSDGQKYILVKQIKTVDDAEIFCNTQYNTSLASIYSEGDNDIAMNLCTNVCTAGDCKQGCSIGANDKQNEQGSNPANWVWNDGSAFHYYNWLTGEPNQYLGRNEDCTILWAGDYSDSSYQGKWNDCPCNGNHSYNQMFLCNAPTASPTQDPTPTPTDYPSINPTRNPTASPIRNPTAFPSNNPTISPTINPSVTPTINPSVTPSTDPSKSPSINPTSNTNEPTNNPTVSPTISPTTTTISPSKYPTISPSTNASKSASINPLISPLSATNIPSIAPYDSSTKTQNPTLKIPTTSGSEASITTTNIEQSEQPLDNVAMSDQRDNGLNGNMLVIVTIESISIVVLFIIICIMCFFMFKFKQNMDRIKCEQPQQSIDKDDLQIADVIPMETLIENDEKQEMDTDVKDNHCSEIDNISNKSDEELYVKMSTDGETKMEIEMLKKVNNGKKNKVNNGYESSKSWFNSKVNIPNCNDIYCQLFIDNGLDTLEIVQLLNEDSLREMEISKPGHIAKIMMEINNLKLRATHNEIEGVGTTVNR